MPIVHRKYPHYCSPPLLYTEDATGVPVANGDFGDLWRCETSSCTRLWQVRRTHSVPGRSWVKPSLWNRLLYRYRKPQDVGLDILDPVYSNGKASVDPWIPSNA